MECFLLGRLPICAMSRRLGQVPARSLRLMLIHLNLQTGDMAQLGLFRVLDFIGVRYHSVESLKAR